MRFSRPRASSLPNGSTRGPTSTRRSACTLTGSWSRGVEIGSGSLGHGLPLALGVGLGIKATSSKGRVFVLVGDAELDEGSNHEAIAAAPRLGVTNLTAIAIDNQSSSLGWPGGIGARFKGEGWSTAEVDGRDHAAIRAGVLAHTGDLPHAVVAHIEPKGS